MSDLAAGNGFSGRRSHDGSRITRCAWRRLRAGVAFLPAIGGTAIGTAVGVGFVEFGSAPAADAAGTCVGPISNHFDGYSFDDLTNLQGISAAITPYSAATCTPHQNNDRYAAWSMIAGSSCPGSYGYAQSGYAAFYPATSPPTDFAQQSSCDGSEVYSNFPTSSKYDTTLGSSIQYETYPDSSGGLISGAVIGGSFTALEDQDVNSTWTGLIIGECYGEVGHDENDMPGTASSPVYFNGPIQFENGGSFSTSYAFSAGYDEQPASWGLSSLTNVPSFTIWTQ